MQPEHLARYSPQQQQDLNLVRMYLQVHTLSDLSDTDRPVAIALNYLDGKRCPDQQITSLWPRQQEPSNSQRRLWKRYITSSFLRYRPFWNTPPTSPRGHTATAPPIPPPVGVTEPTLSLMDYVKTLPRTHRRLLSSTTQEAPDH